MRQPSTDALRKRQERAEETEQQRSVRVVGDRLRKRTTRENENERQHSARLVGNKLQKQTYRQNEDESQRKKRLTDQRKRSARNRSESNKRKSTRVLNGQNSSEIIQPIARQDNVTKGTQNESLRRQHKILERSERVLVDEYVWPMHIPTELKEHCLENFSNHMSMSLLRQSICIICNSRVFFSTIKECPLEDIPNLERLSCHADVIDIISKTQQITHGKDTYCMTKHGLFVFLADDYENSSFFSSFNAIFYKKGYNLETKNGYICQQCYSVLNKNKVPAFSSANKMWIGDIPPVLQQLTIAEEKL